MGALKPGDGAGCWGSSCSVGAGGAGHHREPAVMGWGGLEAARSGFPVNHPEHTSSLPGLQGFVWVTPIPGGGGGGPRITSTSLFAAHVGDLLMGLKERPPPSPRTWCCLLNPPQGNGRDVSHLPHPACCCEQQQVQERERVKHPSEEGSPGTHRGALSSCLVTGALSNWHQQPAGAHGARLLQGRPSCSRTEPPKVASSQHCV